MVWYSKSDRLWWNVADSKRWFQQCESKPGGIPIDSKCHSFDFTSLFERTEAKSSGCVHYRAANAWTAATSSCVYPRDSRRHTLRSTTRTNTSTATWSGRWASCQSRVQKRNLEGMHGQYWKNLVETLQGQKLFWIKVHEKRGLLVRCLFGGTIMYSQREDERKSYGKQAVDEPVTADESKLFRCVKSEIQSI